MDRDGVVDKFGVPAERIIDYLALVGDSADNIPGVPKVGPKTTVKWLTQYGSLDEIVAHADEVKGKIGENLRASLETLELSRALATIKLDVELEQTPNSLMLGEPDQDTFKSREVGYITARVATDDLKVKNKQAGLPDLPAVTRSAADSERNGDYDHQHQSRSC